MDLREQFAEVWLVDFEFQALPGERPVPICLVAHELKSGARLRLWENDLRRLDRAPYGQAANSVVIAYYASAELGCHLALGWPRPASVIDLYAEFRNMTNGLSLIAGAGLLGVLAYFGHPAIAVAEKDHMRALAMRGGPWTEGEKAALLDYCESDVIGVTTLLKSMEPRLDIDRALVRGRYMAAAAAIEHTGVPIDVPTLSVLRRKWAGIQDQLIAAIDGNFGVYEGRTFKIDRFAAWLRRTGIPWPVLPSGALDLSDDTFREMARAYPAVGPLRELRHALSQMRLSELAVGTDGRNRTLLSAYRARTGRNQPSNTKSIFGPSTWLRGLIKPTPGFGLAYIDWSQQEFGIAAALSGDLAMQTAYRSGDPYLAFARQAGAVPPSATKQSHGTTRDQFKACVLAVQYGMGAEALAMRIGQSTARARELLRLHREAYPTFWRWSDACEGHAMLHNTLHTVLGWTVHVGPDANPRSLRNFPMQANGAEMLRIACILGIEAGIPICAPVHDALLIEASLDTLDAIVNRMQALMAQASEIVLDGFQLRSDAKIVRYPDRYMDERGQLMWDRVVAILRSITSTEVVA